MITELHQDIRRVAAGTLILAFTCSASAQAQTRTDEVAKQQAEKAQHLEAYRPNRTEVFLDQVEHGKWILATPRGWYSTLGSVYPGGGFALGGGYRHYLGYDSFVDSGMLYSVLGYKKLQIIGYTPNHVKGRVDVEGSIVWLDATQVAFYGLGGRPRHPPRRPG